MGRGFWILGTLGLNPAQGMDVNPRLSVLCCPSDGLITRPRSPTKYLNRLRNLPRVRRPRLSKDFRATA